MTLRLSVMRWVATLVGVQLLCGIVWIVGPLLAPLESAPARLAVVMALLLCWAAANLALDYRGARREAALIGGVTGAEKDEAAAVGARLAAALKLLRKANGRRFALHEQPWYAIIGPPGAGKTTALLNAGLEFPLAGALGPGGVSGVGGTRLCEWWFTRDAVLIDTAGRYTTQDSNQAVDRAGWDAFLSLLREARPRIPLNGALVAIALDDVVAATPAAQAAHAKAIRERVDELSDRLGVRLPVYVLLTKADLLVGFTEFFDDLDRAGREQVWGTTFPPHPPTSFEQLFDPLLERLNQRLFQRLEAEPNLDRRALIAGFPAQFATVLAPLRRFLTASFGPDATGRTPRLRGVYLTSGTQEGTPIDRLTGALSRTFGLNQNRPAPSRPEAGRAYFLADLLRRVVFQEAMLVADRPGEARRRHIRRVAGFAACAGLAVAGAVWLGVERSASVTTIDRAGASLAANARLAARLPLNPVADADFTALLPWLDATRAATRAAPGAAPGATPGAAAAQHDPMVFAQDAKLAGAARTAYRHALEYGLFPRLVWRAETRVRGALGQPDALYDATRVYLMLGGAGPLDPDLVRAWFARDWAASLPGTAGAASREALARHLDALMREPLPAIALDGPLVAEARATIGRVPLALRAWSRLKPLAAVEHLAPWRPSDALGPAGVQLFMRLSGTALDVGIPGLYTVAGFRDVVLPAIPEAARKAAAESWVVGRPIDPGSAESRNLESDIAGLYAAEYIAAWDAMLADVNPLPLRSLTRAAQDLYILASPHSPMRTLLAAADQQLAPAASLPADSPFRARMAVVDDHYQALRALFTPGGLGSIEPAMRALGDLQQELAKQAASTTKPDAPSAAEDPALALRAEALRQPQPLARWLVALATGGAALRDGGPRGAMIAAWNAAGGPASVCPAVIENRYPFVANATQDASIEAFTRLFGPGGALDGFFNAQLKPYVDTSTAVWRLRAVDGVNAPVTPADLAQFQRAAAIRDLFFPAGASTPLVRYEITPEPLDPGVTEVKLDLGSSTIAATRGTPARPSALTWPGQPPAINARLMVAASPPAAPLELATSGPWAVFRLFDLGTEVTTRTGYRGAARTTLAFAGEDHRARFDLRATPSPFATRLLTEFRCPTVQ